MILTCVCVVSLLEERVTRLHGQLQRTQQHLMNSSNPGSVDRKVLDDLYEDIHWLILVSGQWITIRMIPNINKASALCWIHGSVPSVLPCCFRYGFIM